MQDEPRFIGTSAAIINVNSISVIFSITKAWLAGQGKDFGIQVNMGNMETAFYLYDDEAREFVQLLGYIQWLPSTSNWVKEYGEGGSND